MSGKKAERVGVTVEVAALRFPCPQCATSRVVDSAKSDGLAQVLSGLTGGPDKVRFKKNFPG